MKPMKAVAISIALVMIASVAVLFAAPNGAAQCSYNMAITGCPTPVPTPITVPGTQCSYNAAIINNCGTPLPLPGTFAPPSGGMSDPPLEIGPLAGVAAITPSLVDGVVTISFPQELLDKLNLDRRVLVEYNPIVFDAMLPASKTVSFDYPANRTSIDITVTANLLTGALYLETVTIGIADAIVTTNTSAAVANAPGATAAQASAAPGLAVTGLEGSTASVGLLLVGLGAAVAGTARVRRRDL